MSDYYKRRSKTKNVLKRVLLAVLCFIFVVTVAVSSVFVIDRFFINDAENPSTTQSDTASTQSTSSVPEEPKVMTATLAATGDLLMHDPLITNAKTEDGYDFSNIFKYFASYASSADYAVANLETTLRGTEDGYTYKGYPQFNCPDEIVDAVKGSGFDMLLTANNHSYDTRLKGMLRTLEVVDEKGLDRLGIVKDDTEKRYIIKNVNGINIGMLCYTYETDDDKDKVALNGIPLSEEAEGLVNTFNVNELDTFYEKLNAQLEEMKTNGADATVLFIHWGEEYHTEEIKSQRTMAQKICNLGVDVIIGGHPHVVEPVDLLTSETDSEHKTFCIYSLGNAVSNQRRERMNLSTGHTEDGILFSVTFEKIGDGKAYVKSVDVLPLWVNMFKSSQTGKTHYEIIPLDESIEDWKEAFDLTDTSEKKARESLERTKKIVGKGMDKIKEYLSPESADTSDVQSSSEPASAES